MFGDDYDTPDGTGVRDYIHVTDLISGHIAALKKLETKPGCIIHNLGTGNGTSVLEMVHRFEAVNGVSVPYRIVARTLPATSRAQLPQSVQGRIGVAGLATSPGAFWQRCGRVRLHR